VWIRGWETFLRNPTVLADEQRRTIPETVKTSRVHHCIIDVVSLLFFESTVGERTLDLTHQFVAIRAYITFTKALKSHGYIHISHTGTATV